MSVEQAHSGKSPFFDKAIIVTGASAGIGRALCLRLAREGARLVLASRDRERLIAVAEECEGLGPTPLVVPTDVKNPESCQALIQETLAQRGRLDVLVNNAGMSMSSRFDTLEDLGVFEELMRLNYLGSVYCTHAALGALKETRGLIVAVASLAGMTGVPLRTGYAASKHAMIGFFDSLRIELRAHGIGVTVIAPDFVQSEIRKRAFGRDGAPIGESPLAENTIMSADRCAELMLRAMRKRKRLWIGSLRGRLGHFVKPFIPGALDAVAERTMRRHPT